MKKVLVPTSGFRSAYQSVEYAMQIARTIGAEVHALHVISPEQGSSEPDDETAVDTLRLFELASEEYDVKVRSAVRRGEVVREIIDYAEANQISLIVMGASDGLVVEQWLSHAVLGNCAIPVLVMPFETFTDSELVSPEGSRTNSVFHVSS